MHFECVIFIIIFKVDAKGWVLNLSKVLNVFNTFFQIRNPINKNRQFGIQWNFSINVGCSMHEAAIWITCVQFWVSLLLIFLLLLLF